MSQPLRPTAWRNADRTPSRPFRVTGTADGWPTPQSLHSANQSVARRPSASPVAADAERLQPPPDTRSNEQTD